MAEFQIPKFALIVDTNEYAGNFERQLVAFMTGCVGECSVGQREADMFLDACPKSNIPDKVTWYTADDGCSRPATIWPSPDGKYNSVAAFFSDKPTATEFGLLNERAHLFLTYSNQAEKTYNRHTFKIKQFRWITFKLSQKERVI